MKTRLALAPLGFLLLTGCDWLPRLAPGEDLLNPPGRPVARSPDCASCHPYPPADPNHEFHLHDKDVKEEMAKHAGLNGDVTCLDCHAASIARFTSGAGFRPVPASDADSFPPAATEAEVRALVAAYARRGESPPWTTARAHFDGTVQVGFTANLVAAGRPLSTAWKPAGMTCSAIACHESLSDTYRWTEDPDD
jgi:hypothetical protein